MPASPRSFAVIGLGTFGGTVAADLARFGNRVLGIDVAERPVADLADFLAETVIADGTDEAALREAGVGQYDVVVVAIGDNLEASIVCTMNLRLIGAKCIWAKAMSRTHHRILTKLGADRVIHPELEVGQQIAQVLHNPAVKDYVGLGNGFIVVTIVVPERLEGRTLASLGIGERHEVRCLGMMRGTVFHAPEAADVALKPDDRLILLGRRAELRVFGDSL